MTVALALFAVREVVVQGLTVRRMLVHYKLGYEGGR
jgi:hypothetical protein